MNKWHAVKMTQGPKAGKWALVNPWGGIVAYYPRKKAAERDATLYDITQRILDIRKPA